MSVKDILESYDEVSVINEIEDKILLISLFGKEFLFIAPLGDKPSSVATIWLYNDDGTDFPHVMLRDIPIPKRITLPEGNYRWVCLYEQESIVNTLVSYEDKITDAIDRLIELLSMNDFEKEREFQKEFMFYWNGNAAGENRFSIYLAQEDRFAEMETFFCKRNVRVVEKGLHLSDIDYRENGERKWIQHLECDVYYIPITDNRGILPPRRGHDWTSRDVKNIVYAQQIEHISDDTFQKVRDTIPKTRNVILVFGMKLEWINVLFAVRIKCNNIIGHSLLKKVLDDIVQVEPLFTERKDYMYLNEQLGNDIGLLKKSVLVIGAGSLGSYVAFELVKNGAAHIKIYDGDNLEDENILRWAYAGVGKGSNKAEITSYMLNLLHPEVDVLAIQNNIDEKALSEEMSKVDMIIFTIGSSDEQLRFNRVLKANQCPIPVIYTWLEAGGIYSHVLYVNYQKTGCYECLYTDETGGVINNRARMNSDEIMNKAVIRNGCGGTRVAYGTRSLLRTTAALLDTIERIQKSMLTESTLIDISPTSVCISKTTFPVEVCKCCGNER